MPTHPLTLADVLLAVPRFTFLSERQQRDLQSAVRCVCRICAVDPATVKADDLALLQSLMAAAKPERTGMSAARWSVIRSQFQKSLRLTGAAEPLQTAKTELTATWEALNSAIPKAGTRRALSRFSRYCSQEGIEPEAVDQATFDRFGEALASGSLVRNPGEVHLRAIRAWSELPEGIAGLSLVRIGALPAMAGQAGRIPLSAFPKAFQEDLAAFQSWCGTADAMDDTRRSKALRPQTVISYTSAIHSAADAAVKAGMDIGEITAIAVLARPEVFKALLRQLIAAHQGQISTTAQNVATVVVIVATDWVRQSVEEIAVLKKLKAKLPKLRPGLTAKNRELLAAFDDEALLGRFLALPDVLWAEAQSGKLKADRRIVRAQMALLIGILQITPLRRSSICRVAFGKHITWPNGTNAPALI